MPYILKYYFITFIIMMYVKLLYNNENCENRYINKIESFGETLHSDYISLDFAQKNKDYF